MKNSVKIGVIACVIAFGGCNFFDNSSPSTTAPEQIFSTVSKTEGAVAAVYELFGEERSYRNRLACGFAGLNTDIEYNRNSSDGKKGYAAYQVKPDDVDLSDAKGRDPWGYLNTIIERCNNIVEGINKYGYPAANREDSASFDYLKGEALFLRSFALLEKVKYWGDVPVSVVPFDGYDLNKLTTGKVDRNVAFEQIRTDLKAAASLMEWSADAQIAQAVNDVRRPSKAAALALLARADLMYAGKAVRPTALVAGNSDYKIDWNLPNQEDRIALYKEIMWACDQVIRKEGDIKLNETDYAQIFKDLCADKTDYATMEYIWVIPFGNGSRGQFMNYHSAKFNALKAKGVTYTMGVLLHNKEYSDEVKSNFALSMVPTLLFDYDKDDKRRDVTVLPYIWNVDKSYQAEKTLKGEERSVICLYPKIQTNPTQWSCGKYRIEWMSRDNLGADDGVDFPIIRYADVLLMYAEASIGSLDQLGEGGVTPDAPVQLTGKQAFDKIRNRAGVSLIPLTLANIQEERKFEFAGEYIRKYDLMRWGILKDKLVEAHNRVEDLRANHEGHKFYVKYKQDPNKTYLQPGAKDAFGNLVERAYVVDSVYGFRMEEEGEGNSDWVNKGCQFSSKLVSTSYILYDYDNPESLNSRQYWPIFALTLGSSNGTLFNNYGY